MENKPVEGKEAILNPAPEGEVPPRVFLDKDYLRQYEAITRPPFGPNPVNCVPYVPEAALSAEKQRGLRAVEEARAKAFEDVLAAAKRIYQEELDSDPSDYFYTKKAVAEAQASRAAKEPS